MELLRTLLFIPGNRERMIDKARALRPDALVFDLEDAVPPAEKGSARAMVRDALAGGAFGGIRSFVRVNSATSGLLPDDIKTVVSPALFGIVLPKVEEPEDVLEAHRMLEEQEKGMGMRPGRTRILPIIETVRGVLGLSRIAGCHERLIGLSFGAEDFATDLGVARSKEGIEAHFPRVQVALYARLAGVVAVDTVYSDVNDEAGLVRDAETARQLGFKGKYVLHPRQIDPVNRVFTPSEAEIEHARRVIAAYQEAEARGEASVALDGKMIDIPVVERARALIAISHQLPAISESDGS